MLQPYSIQNPLINLSVNSTSSNSNDSLTDQVTRIQQTPISLNLNSSEISTENGAMNRSEYLALLKQWKDAAPTAYIKEHRQEIIGTLLACYTNRRPCLRLSNLELQTLPMLPPHITELTLFGLNLIELPELPPTLKILECANNQLSSLPNLPSTLEKLNCNYNQLSHLPALPENINELRCEFNQLISLPELPMSLTCLAASYNSLTELPTSINNSVNREISISNNPLPNSIITQYQTRAMNNSDKPRTLLESISSWFINPLKNDVVQKFATIKNDENTQAFSKFLDKLQDTKSVQDSIEAKKQVQQWLTCLSESPQLQEKTFLLAYDATESCEDRVTLTWNAMKKAALLQDVEQGNYDNKLPNLIKAAREMFRLEKLETIAREKVSSLQYVDEIEVYLAYQTKLYKDLQLESVATDMFFFDVASVSQDDLSSATLITKTAENEQFHSWIAQWEPLHEVIKRTAPKLWETAEIDLDEYQQRLDNEIDKISGENNAALHSDSDLLRVLGQKVHDEMKKDTYEPLVANYFTNYKQSELLAPQWQL